MQDQRRHQRIRFSVPPTVKIGFGGVVGEGLIENLSLSGMMFRSPMRLEIGRLAGCEFSIFGSPLIDVPVTVVSQVGDMYGGRFQTGPINQIVIEDAINAGLDKGDASILSVRELDGRKVMRISGGLNGGLRNDFMHALTRVGVSALDMSGVTVVDQAGLALCMVATSRYGAEIGEQSASFASAWKAALARPGTEA